MTQLQDRKAEERDLHDHLRGELADDPKYTSNRKFYAISDLNKGYVQAWLAERCRGKRVLDYCCGNGDYTRWLAEAGADAYGIDISPVSIENAQGKAQAQGLSDRVHYQVMDAEAMTFPDQYFDYAVVNGVLHHLDLPKAYPELARVLKPEGAVICTEALKHNALIHLYRKRTPHLRSAWETAHILGKSEIEAARAAFGSVRVLRFFHLLTLAAVPFRNTRLFPILLRILARLDALLLRLPILRWQAWMGVFLLTQPRRAPVPAR